MRRGWRKLYGECADIGEDRKSGGAPGSRGNGRRKAADPWRDRPLTLSGATPKVPV
ncbi:hypothetical protein Sliba_65660 [Streptomyces nigrescens]|uniref:Uncharacterized protein n=1 Tax=Streptomyces nigrescens TaxID=1920 RepID=A0A640TQ35_STRNI|nr:hypothetical protein Sliba_65660 [Streptomyces libani subsp. libani]GGW05553.1 hypothetical protein GCM10010500_70050 [Streptomyces libani subsp. libani]